MWPDKGCKARHLLREPTTRAGLSGAAPGYRARPWVTAVLIDSPRNAKVRMFRSLHQAKGRRQVRAFLAEGARLVAEALDAGWPIAAAAVCDELLRPAARAVAQRLRNGPWPCYEMSQRAFRALSAEQNPQGVAVAARSVEQKVDGIAAGPGDVMVGAWELADPGNMGTLVRTAEFLGCRALVAIGECVDLFEPKTVRATAGAIFHLPVARAAEDDFWRWVQEAGAIVVATGPREGQDAHAMKQVRSRPAVVLVGSEARGLPEHVMERADVRIGVKRRGRVESLNAAVAAALCIYRIVETIEATGKGDDGEE